MLCIEKSVRRVDGTLSNRNGKNLWNNTAKQKRNTHEKNNTMHRKKKTIAIYLIGYIVVVAVVTVALYLKHKKNYMTDDSWLSIVEIDKQTHQFQAVELEWESVLGRKEIAGILANNNTSCIFVAQQFKKVQSINWWCFRYFW